MSNFPRKAGSEIIAKRRASVAALHHRGLGQRAISRALGLTVGAVHGDLRALGLKKAPKRKSLLPKSRPFHGDAFDAAKVMMEYDPDFFLHGRATNAAGKAFLERLQR